MANIEFYFETDQLMIWRPTGMLDIGKIREFITFLEESGHTHDPHFSRFVDLSRISGISVQYRDLYPIAQRRKSYFKTNISRKVKMVFLVSNPLSYGMARMYQTISAEPNLEMHITENREEASRILGLDHPILNT